jgi:hypothetical protein
MSVLVRDVTGTIPQCIWSLPNLTSLHLAGNSFTGKLFNGDDDEYQRSQVRRAVLWRAYLEAHAVLYGSTVSRVYLVPRCSTLCCSCAHYSRLEV